jgi:hypothetical protein
MKSMTGGEFPCRGFRRRLDLDADSQNQLSTQGTVRLTVEALTGETTTCLVRPPVAFHELTGENLSQAFKALSLLTLPIISLHALKRSGSS